MKAGERTSGYRNWCNQRMILPVIEEGFAKFADRWYEIRKDGWRRVREAK